MRGYKFRTVFGALGILYSTIQILLLYFGVITSSDPGAYIVSSIAITITSTLLLGLAYLDKRGISLLPEDKDSNTAADKPVSENKA